MTDEMNLNPQGEDPAVAAVLKEEFAEMPNEKALDIALALQQILRGQDSLLDNQDKMAEEIRRIKAQMAKYDEDAEKFKKDQNKFMTDVLDKAESLKAVGSEKDKIIAKGSQMFQNALSEARANSAVDKMEFDAMLARQPKVRVISAGILESGIANGQPVTRITDEVVRIRHRTWVLPRGQEVEVPQAVADALNNRRKSQKETQERQEALSGMMDNNKLIEKTKEINEKYKTDSELPPGF